MKALLNINKGILKRTCFIIFFFLLRICLNAQSLSGIVRDSAGRQPLAGATVFFPQLKKGITTDNKGKYKIILLQNGNYEVNVHAMGHASVTKQIAITGDVTLDWALPVAATMLKEVIVTSLGNATTIIRAPVPVTVVSHNDFLQQASTNVIDAIAKQPGITEITEGPGISKPEINGLGYNRVLTLFNGERQEDFQWGDEHGILIDPNAVYDAEIIRGAASLQYGANAVGGVVSFKSEPFAKNGTVQGSVQSEYQTNNGLIGNSLDIGGDNNGLAWDLRGSFEAAHCYWDSHDGYVWGTAFDQSNLRGSLQWDKEWGYSRLSVSILHRRLEVPDGNRDSATGQFAFDYPQNGLLYPSKANFLSYHPDIAGDQILGHDEVWWENSISTGYGTIKADIGYTQSIRHEIDSGTVGVYNLIVHDIPYSFKYQVAGDSSGLKLTTGVNGMYEFGNNYPEPPAPYIGYSEIPNYRDFDIGGYGILEKDYKSLTISGGLRSDLRAITGFPMYLGNYETPQQEQVPAGTPGSYEKYTGFSNTYFGLSGSIGASYQLPGKTYVKINFAKSYRAPSIQELNSNALNLGSNAYIIGYPDLKAEQGYETDIAYGNNGRDLNFEVDGFYNFIKNFIFQDRLAGINGGDSLQQGFPVFQYKANTALLTGVTAFFNIHPSQAKWFEWKNGFTYIYSFLPHQSDSTQHVPLTPAPRLTSKIRFKLADRYSSILQGVYFELGVEHDWAQKDIYSELYTELPSFAYTLYNAGVGTNFVTKRTKHTVCSLFIHATNLTNIAYVDHTSHNQYFLAYNATPVTVTRQGQGIYNMGRNVGIKLIFPFGTYKSTETKFQGSEY